MGRILGIEKKYLLGLFLLVSFSCLYISTAPRGVYDGDSGELTAAIHGLSLAHSTGFPAYVLSAKIFTLIAPIGGFDFRLNVYSALLTAVSVSLLFLILVELGLSMWGSFLASVIFGLGSSVWSNAGTARVYPMALLFILVLLSIFVRWQKEKKTSYLYLYALIWGFSFGTHLLMLTMVWPLLAMVGQDWLHIKSKPVILWRGILLFAIPFVQYAFLPIAYLKNPAMAWGKIDSVDGFVSYITQRQYTFKMFARGWSGTILFFEKVGTLISSEFGILILLIGLTGLILLYRKNKTLGTVVLLMGLSNVAIMFAYGTAQDIDILYRYLFIAHLAVAIGVAYGISVLQKIDSSRWLSISLIGLLIFAEFRLGYVRNNRRDNFIVTDTAHNILETVEPNSVVFVILDSVYGPILYLQSDNYRSDVVVVQSDLLGADWYVNNLIRKYPTVVTSQVLTVKGNGPRAEEIIRNAIKNYPIYSLFANGVLSEEKTLADEFEFTPAGLLNRISPKNADTRIILNRNDSLWNKYQMRSVEPSSSPAAIDDDLGFLYYNSLHDLGVAYFKSGFLLKSVEALKRSLAIHSTPTAQQDLSFVESKLGPAAR